MTAPVLVTFFTDYAAQSKREERVTLDELAEAIRRMSAGEKRRLPWLKFARFGDRRTEKNSLRHDANVISISGVEADFDAGDLGFDEAVEIAEKAPLRCLIYTSPSHTEDKPRWRVCAPTSEELPPHRRADLMARLNGLYRGVFAVESFTLSQSFYWGAVGNNPAHRAAIVEGECVDRLDELDLIAVGKPNGAGPGMPPGPLDEDALAAAIVSGAAYHTCCVRLVGKWAQAGVPFMEAQQRLEALFDSVFPPDRDRRWRDRRADIPRIIRDIYGKEAGQKDERVEFTIGGAGPGAAPEDSEDEAEAEPEPPQRAGFTQAEFAALVVPPADPLLGAAFTTTTRAMLVGPPGIGKTMLMLGMADAMSEGKAFLHWPAGRKSRTLYVDGEMSVRLFQERSADAARRNGGNSDTLILLSAAAIDGMPPLNFPAGQAFIDAQIEAHGGFDFIFFDNIQALLVGDMREEEPWRAVLPWVRRLTNRGIGQVWGHHTGIDKTRSYGTSTREWQMDSVLLLGAVESGDADLAFTVEFLKARERTPANRGEFAPMLVTLTGDIWTSEPSDRAGGAKRYARDYALGLLQDALVRWGEIPPACEFIPPATACVLEVLWRQRFADANISDASRNGLLKAFRRAAQDLIERGLVRKHDPWVWIVR